MKHKVPGFNDGLENLPLQKEGKRYYVSYNGGIQAGFPSPAEDFLSDRISLDERYLSRVESTFINRVTGLSMFPDYHIGDILIIRSDYEPQQDDDIVVSVNHSDYTLKRYDKKNKQLKAVNPDYTSAVKISENDEVIILGVVDVIIRERKKRK